MQYIITLKKKKEMLFNFWLAEKYKNIEIDFSNQRKKERKES